MQPESDVKSGDNDALKHYIKNLEPREARAHIANVPQCTFNSYLWRTSLRNYLRYMSHPNMLKAGIWRPQHFIVHFAGWNKFKVRTNADGHTNAVPCEWSHHV